MLLSSKDLKKKAKRLVKVASEWPLTYMETYKIYRTHLTKILKIAKHKYHKTSIKNNQSYPKGHWDAINSVLGRTKGYILISLDLPIDNISTAFNNNFIKSTIQEEKKL